MEKIKIFMDKINISTEQIINHEGTAQIAASGFLNPQSVKKPAKFQTTVSINH